jgi:uncharacterized membrane protein YjgN (DUF898 family)
MTQLPMDTQPSTTYRVEYRGTGEGMFGLVLLNFILRVFTLNIYYPWAKTEFRKHVWANTFFQDQALVYRGLGIEMFKGFCKVILIYVAFIILNFGGTLLLGKSGSVIVTVVGAVIFFALVPRVLVGSYRYRLTRTTWRGVRFNLKRIENDFTWMFFKGAVLTVVTLGLYAPVFYRSIYKMKLEATSFGNLDFRYSGTVGDEYMIYVKGVLLSVLTLGIYVFWFAAELMRYRLAHTQIGNAVLSRDVTGLDFVKMGFLCGLALIFTFGIAYPWVFAYRARLILGKTVVSGFIDFDSIVQSTTAVNASGEAASDFFDLDNGFFNFDFDI